MDGKINQLEPGYSVIISECNGIQCVAERSGDGKRLRFVRVSDRGFEVFKDVAF